MKIEWITLKLGLTQLSANKLRSFLTMLGIVIGIASVISIISLGAGAQSLITNALKNLGTDSITVLPGNSNDNGPPASALGITVTTLTLADAEAIAELPNVVGVNGFNNGSGEITFLTRYINASYSGVNSNYPEVETLTLAEGRFFTEQELQSKKNVAVLGDDIVSELFPLTSALGQKIKIQNESFLVVGVLERKGSTLFENPDSRVYIPITVAQSKLTGKNHLDLIRVRTTDESLIEPTKEQIRELLRFRHGIEDPDNDDFSVRSVTQALDIFTGVTNALRFFLAVIAAISLVIGGISVMNIMLMNVKERTREIGLKKAIGAKPRQIQNQFLAETILLTLIGGGMGLLAGIGFSLLVALIMQALEYNWSFHVSLSSIVVSLAVSAAIGVVFGVYPARKAAQLNPIDALRYE